MSPALAFLGSAVGLLLGGPAEAIEAVPAPGGRVVLREAGSELASFAPRTPAASRGTPVARAVSIEGRRVVEVRIPIAGTARQEVWVAQIEAGSGRVREPIWWDVAGARDADGETAVDVSLSEGGIEIFQRASRLSRCDGTPVRLFTKAWSFDERRFRPRPPALPPAAGRTLRGRRGDPAAFRGRPIGGFFWTGASTTAADRQDARMLAAPVELNDTDPTTVWSEAVRGDGRGEILVARTAGPPTPIVGLRILPGDTSSAAAFRASGRPRKLALLFGPAAHQRFDIELLEDADGGKARFRQPFWVLLPPSVPASCVTLVIREVTPPGAREAPSAIADVDIITELDAPDGLAKLVAAAVAGDGCELRVPLIVAAGPTAVRPLAEAAGRAQAAGRECVLEALTHLLGRRNNAALLTPGDEETAGEALAKALADASASEEKLVLAALPRLASPPVATLARIAGAQNSPEPDRARAARALAALCATEAGDEARRALVLLVGSGPSTVRKAVRDALMLSDAPPAAADSVRAAAVDAATGPAPRRADLILILGTLASRDVSGASAALPVLREAAGAGAAFEVRARAIQGLGKLGDSAELTRLRQSEPNPVLRSLATRELGAVVAQGAVPALRAALEDPDPRVREAAAAGLARHRDIAATPLLLASAKQEPWPFVRRAKLEALGTLCGPGTGDLAIRAIERDVGLVRRAAMSALVRCRDPRARVVLVAALERATEDPDLRAHASGLLAELGDASAARPMAEALRRLLTESRGDPTLEGVAMATVRALAALRGPEAVEGALALLADERPQMRKAALEALGRLCAPGHAADRAAAGIRAATRDPSPEIAAAAIGAARRCESRR